MIQNLRRRAEAALADIESLNLSSASTANKSVKNNIALKSPTKSNVDSSYGNYLAGCNLIKEKENVWRDLHMAAEINASKSRACDESISNISDSIRKTSIALSDANISFDEIPNVIRTIENCSAIMLDIKGKTADIEALMIELSDVFEAFQLQKEKFAKNVDMIKFKEQKLAELEKERSVLTSKHAQVIQQNDQQMYLVRQERQKVFEDAFKNDMDYFKKVGNLPKIEHVSTEHSLKLEEIVLDDGIEELDKFLESK